MRRNIVLFAGPSLVGLDNATFSGITLYPPVLRGDVQRLVEIEKSPGVMIIADGIFHSYPSVGHAELRLAINSGWDVWGVSSMGAIRAAEMRGLGMNGFGRVYEHFANDPDFTDDEVALLHRADSPYTAVTEPLVHVRYFLDTLVFRQSILSSESSAVLFELKQLWFGYRSLALLERLLSIHTSMESSAISAELRDFYQYRLKTQDLAGLLKLQPWKR